MNKLSYLIILSFLVKLSLEAECFCFTASVASPWVMNCIYDTPNCTFTFYTSNTFVTPIETIFINGFTFWKASNRRDFSSWIDSAKIAVGEQYCLAEGEKGFISPAFEGTATGGTIDGRLEQVSLIQNYNKMSPLGFYTEQYNTNISAVICRDKSFKVNIDYSVIDAVFLDSFQTISVGAPSPVFNIIGDAATHGTFQFNTGIYNGLFFDTGTTNPTELTYQFLDCKNTQFEKCSLISPDIGNVQTSFNANCSTGSLESYNYIIDSATPLNTQICRDIDTNSFSTPFLGHAIRLTITLAAPYNTIPPPFKINPTPPAATSIIINALPYKSKTELTFIAPSGVDPRSSIFCTYTLRSENSFVVRPLFATGLGGFIYIINKPLIVRYKATDIIINCGLTTITYNILPEPNITLLDPANINNGTVFYPAYLDGADDPFTKTNFWWNLLWYWILLIVIPLIIISSIYCMCYGCCGFRGCPCGVCMGCRGKTKYWWNKEYKDLSNDPDYIYYENKLKYEKLPMTENERDMEMRKIRIENENLRQRLGGDNTITTTRTTSIY